MSTFKTHLTVLEASASKYASAAVFKVPKLDTKTGRVQEWQSITYREFQQDVELFAKYWAHTLKSRGVLQRSIVGLWIGGTTYTDVLHVYGITRAGYIPQLFSLRLPNPAVIYELLRKANAKALMYDTSYESIIGDSPIPTFLAVNAKTVGDIDEPLPQIPPVVNGDDMAFMFHTSGSTSGMPKLVPWSYTWLDNAIDKGIQVQRHDILETGIQIVGSWLGSVCHSGQNLLFLSHFQAGCCTIQPTTINFSPEELVDMIERCGLNSLQQMGSYLAENLRRSQRDPKFLSVLRGIMEVGYGGLPIPQDAEEWAEKSGIPIRTIFGSTECGFQLVPVRQDVSPILFRVLDGVSYEFRPVSAENNLESGHSSGARLLELIVLRTSPDCPHPSLCHSDGDFHSGDLFEEVHPGQYLSRGRNDDWIKSANGLRCDTKAIENNVGETCGHLVSQCIVVGYGRSSPTLFVEPAVEMDHEELKTQIFRATRPFNSRRYLHEQIISEKMIIVVPRNALPRTASKGNIRRKAVEEAYKSELDALYETL